MAILHWKSSVSGDWSIAANWDLNVVPQAGDTVTIDAPGVYTVTLSGTSVVGNLTISDPMATLNDQGTLTVTGSVANAGTFNVRPAPGIYATATLLLSGTNTVATVNSITGYSGIGQIENEGVIRGNGVLNQLGYSLQNVGTIEANGGTLEGGPSFLSGIFQIDTGSTLVLDNMSQTPSNGLAIQFAGANARLEYGWFGITNDLIPSLLNPVATDTIFLYENQVKNVSISNSQLHYTLTSGNSYTIQVGGAISPALVANIGTNLATSIVFSNAPAVATGGAIVIGNAGTEIVTLAGDTAFPIGSTLTLGPGGRILYQPGIITPVLIGMDSIAYTLTNPATGAITSQTASVFLTTQVNVLASQRSAVVNPEFTYQAGSDQQDFNYLQEFVVDARTISATINGSAVSSLTVTGGGAVTMGDNVTNVPVVRLMDWNNASPYDFTANDTPGLIIFTSPNNDIVQAGNGGDTIIANAANTTILGGSGGDKVYADRLNLATATVTGGAGHNSLVLNAPGTEVMGTGITGMDEVHLCGGTEGQAGYNFTANATSGLVIVGSAGNDVITVGDASQTVYTFGDSSRVLATAATASAEVYAVPDAAQATLEIKGGGSASLNVNDSHGLVVVLDQATLLDMGRDAFLTAIATSAGSMIVAHQALQTLVSLQGGDTLIGAIADNTYLDTFQGTGAGLNQDLIENFGKTDVIHVTDVVPGLISYQQGTLQLGSDSVRLQGAFASAHFQMTGDGGVGSLIRYL